MWGKCCLIVGALLVSFSQAAAQTGQDKYRPASEYGRVPLPDLNESTVSGVILTPGLGLMEPSSFYAERSLARWNAPAVVRLDILLSNNTMQPCTATLLPDGWIITARHCFVVNRDLKAVSAKAIFNFTHSFEVPSNLIKVDVDVNSISVNFSLPNGDLNETLDVAVARLQTTSGLPKPAILSRAAPVGNSSAYLISHPQGGKRRITRGACRPSTIGRSAFEHTCDTLPGSSGGAIFDDETRKIVGIHTRGTAPGDPPSNAAVRIDRLAPQLEAIMGSNVFSSGQAAVLSPSNEPGPPNLEVMRLTNLARLNGRLVEAMQGLDDLADGGNLRAKYEIGMLYYNGRAGLPANKEKAKKIIAEVAAAGDPSAKLREFVWKNDEFIFANGERAAYLAHREGSDFEPERDPVLEQTILDFINNGADFGFAYLNKLEMGRLKGFTSEDGSSGFFPGEEQALVDALEHERLWAKTGSFSGVVSFANSVRAHNVKLASVIQPDNIEATRVSLTRESVGYLEQAAEVGCLTCWYSLSQAYDRTSLLENGQQELYFLDRAIDSGIGGADKVKARLLWRGAVGLEKNPEAAVPVLEVKPESSQDFQTLSVAYFEGVGVKQNGFKGLKYARQAIQGDTVLGEQLPYLVARHFETSGDTRRAHIYYSLCSNDSVSSRFFGKTEVWTTRVAECETKSKTYWNSLSAVDRESYLNEICSETKSYPALEGFGTHFGYFKCTETGVNQDGVGTGSEHYSFDELLSWPKN